MKRQSTKTPRPESDERLIKSQGQHKTKLPRWFLPGLILAIIGIGVFLLAQSPQEDTLTANGESPRDIGPETAPVVIAEYADFACITCKAWHQFGVRERVLEAYGEQVRFVWHDFPVTSPLSPKAAEAGFCAHDQDEFWAYHDIAFENAPALRVENLIQYAEEIGLDRAQFAACLESGRHAPSVEAELKAASNHGLFSVPSFIVNDQRLIGPPSFEQLSATIDSILDMEN